DERLAVHEKIDGRFHIRQKGGCLWWQRRWHRHQLDRGSQKVTFMGVKAEDQPALPLGSDPGTHCHHLSNRGVSILERKANRTGKGHNGLVHRQVSGGLASVEQQLSAWADR